MKTIKADRFLLLGIGYTAIVLIAIYIISKKKEKEVQS
jgi:hypothetical protein